MTKQLAAAILMISFAVLVSSCTSAENSGPLDFGSEKSTVCGPLPDFGEAALGVNLPNGLPRGVTLETVSLINARGVEFQGAYLMPMQGFRLMLDKFPPTSQFPYEWAQAIEAEGAVVRSNGPYDIVVHVISEEAGGTLDGIRIEYSFEGVRYSDDSMLGLRLSRTGCE
jgi:hypothetical protein